MSKPKIEDAPDFTTVRKLKKHEAEFTDLATRLNEAADAERQWAEEKRSLSAQIETMLRDANVQIVRCGNLRVEYITSRAASRIDPVKLVEAGVDTTVVAACTIPGKEYSYAKASVIKES